MAKKKSKPQDRLRNEHHRVRETMEPAPVEASEKSSSTPSPTFRQSRKRWSRFDSSTNVGRRLRCGYRTRSTCASRGLRGTPSCKPLPRSPHRPARLVIMVTRKHPQSSSPWACRQRTRLAPCGSHAWSEHDEKRHRASCERPDPGLEQRHAGMSDRGPLSWVKDGCCPDPSRLFTSSNVESLRSLPSSARSVSRQSIVDASHPLAWERASESLPAELDVDTPRR